MRISLKPLILLSAVFLFLPGCSPSIDANTWILAVENDTISVGNLGDEWTQLDSTQKILFLSMESPVEEYIITYGRKMILQREFQEEGLLDTPEILYARSSHLLHTNAALVKQMLIAREVNQVTEDDISYYRRFLGKNVSYTVNPFSENESESMHAHLPDLPRQLGIHLDTLETGQTALDGTGLEVRLDYVSITDTTLIQHALEDSSIVAEMAIEGLSEARYARGVQNKIVELFQEYSVSVDYPALDTLSQFLLGEVDMPGDRIIVNSDFRNWTVSDLGKEVFFLSTRIPIRPDSPEWLLEMVNSLVLQSYYLEFMEHESRETLDSLTVEADRFLLETASNIYYENTIRSSLAINEDNIIFEYENLQEPFTVQEKRSIQIARIPRERMDEFERAVNQGHLDEFVTGLEGIQHLAANPSAPQISYPIAFSQVPGGHGEEIFQLSPADTVEWLGPFDLFANDDMVLIKLIEVFPERIATMDESRDELRTLALQRQEEETVLALMLQLEEKHEFAVNREILDLLPDDLELWNQL